MKDNARLRAEAARLEKRARSARRGAIIVLTSSGAQVAALLAFALHWNSFRPAGGAAN